MYIFLLLLVFIFFRGLYLLNRNFDAIDLVSKMADIDIKRDDPWRHWFETYREEMSTLNWNFVIKIFDVRKWTLRQLFPKLYTKIDSYGEIKKL